MQKYDVGARNPGTYETWIEEEGVPIHEALIGVEDVAELKREAWPRVSGFRVGSSFRGQTFFS